MYYEWNEWNQLAAFTCASLEREKKTSKKMVERAAFWTLNLCGARTHTYAYRTNTTGKLNSHILCVCSNAVFITFSMNNGEKSGSEEIRFERYKFAGLAFLRVGVSLCVWTEGYCIVDLWRQLLFRTGYLFNYVAVNEFWSQPSSNNRTKHRTHKNFNCL